MCLARWTDPLYNRLSIRTKKLKKFQINLAIFSSSVRMNHNLSEIFPNQLSPRGSNSPVSDCEKTKKYDRQLRCVFGCQNQVLPNLFLIVTIIDHFLLSKQKHTDCGAIKDSTESRTPAFA